MMHYTNILKVKISAVNYTTALRKIDKLIFKNQKTYICVAAAHLIMECQKNVRLLKGVNKSGLVTPDGMPTVWISKLYGNSSCNRVYGPTLMDKLCQLAVQKGYKIFLLGGSKGQSLQLKRVLQSRYSGVSIVGNQDTPMKKITHKKNFEIIYRINESKANIVFVGMGCPWQELWMINNREMLKPEVLIGVGAAFDFITNRKKQAPLWVQTYGLEWFFRLVQEPRRLYYRYTVLNLQFTTKIIWQIIKDFILRKLNAQKNSLLKPNVSLSS